MRPDASFRAVIDITGNHDKRDGVFQRRVDEVVKRPCRCIPEGATKLASTRRIPVNGVSRWRSAAWRNRKRIAHPHGSIARVCPESPDAPMWRISRPGKRSVARLTSF